jgi:arylsulfatase A-like enzyme
LTTIGAQTINRYAAAGAERGLLAWITYAVVEYALWPLSFRFVRAHCANLPLRWDAGLETFGWYPILGAVAGALAGVFVWVVGRPEGLPYEGGNIRGGPEGQSRGHARWAGNLHAGEILSALACLTVVLATLAGVTSHFEIRSVGRALLLVSAGVAACLALAAGSAALGRPVRVVTNPWVVSVVLLAPPRVVNQVRFDDPRILIYAAGLAYIGATTLGLWLQWRRSAGEPGPQAQTAAPVTGARARRLIPPLVGAIAVLAAAVWLDGTASPGRPSARALPADPRAPNVILIVMDTVRADHLSVYGYERDTTPNLRRFGEGATTYLRAVSAADHTLSSHATLFTGMFPASHGAHPGDPADRRRPAGGFGLSSAFLTLAERLSAAGYATAGVVANYGFLSGGFNLDQGFDAFLVRFSRCAPPSPFPWIERLGDSGFRGRVKPRGEETYHNAERINRDALALVDRLKRRGQRFFLFVNYMDAHWPYAPPPPFDTRFPGSDPGFDPSGYLTLRDSVLKGERRLTERERRHLVAQYDGGIAFLDSQLARLFDRLRQLDLYDSSLIVVTSDHGEAFGERQLLEHGTSVYQDQIHVPLLIKYPGRRDATVVRDTVSTADVMPTVLDQLRIPVPASIEGRSLLAASMPTRPIVSESYPRPYFQNLGQRFQHVERAVIEGPLKLITSTSGKRELYNLDDDPHEGRNLYEARDPVAGRLQARLEGWLKTAAVRARQPAITDPATLERLRSLGYVK